MIVIVTWKNQTNPNELQLQSIFALSPTDESPLTPLLDEIKR